MSETQEVPEDAVLEAEADEQRIASQSDMALILDALKQLTKELADLKKLQETKWEETEQFRRAGRF